MPAKSKAQQRLFGMVHAVQKGEIEAPSKKVKQLAKKVKPSVATEFAETKRKKLRKLKAKHEKMFRKYSEITQERREKLPKSKQVFPSKKHEPSGSFPIDTKKRAIAALAYRRYASDPAKVKAKVCAKYPELDSCKKSKK